MNQELEQVSRLLNEGIIQELHLQGHVLLEELESTIRAGVKITNKKDATVLEGFAVQYIQKMETGVLPSQLGSKAHHLAALTVFYSRLGFDAKTAAIKAKRLLPHHFREGVPTDFSKKHSKTGERKEFIKATWGKNEKQVDTLVDKGMDVVFNDQFKLQKSETI